jgi:H+/Cl- antiporter ClcA
MHSLRELLSSIKTARLADFDAWHGRIIVWIAAATAGLVVVMFARATEHAIDFFFSYQQLYWWLPLLVTPLAAIGIVWMTNKWFKGAAGSGIPQTIAALNTQGDHFRLPTLVSFKIAIGKIVFGVAGLAAGFSAGREGPSVQIGASIMHAFRHFLPKNFTVDPKHLILAGGAAGISAAFNTPLAGIVFAIEELGRRFEQKTSGVIISAIVLSGLVSISLQGNYTYFGHLSVGLITGNIAYPVILCGFLCGVAGGIFSRTLISSSKYSLNGKVGKLRKLHPLYWAGFCGLMVALLGVASDGTIHGSGYIYAKEILHGTGDDTLLYAPLKYLATIFTYLSGIPGGIFAPSLSIGAGIANDLMPVFSNFQTSAICALCMAGFLAGVTQAPLTSFIIVMEMIDGHEMVISLMAVTMIASIVSRLFSQPLYMTLADNQVSKQT